MSIKHYFFGLILFCVSCNPYQSYLQQIDALEKRIDVAQQEFQKIDQDVAKKSMAKIQQLSDSIRSFAKDTASLLVLEKRLYSAANMKKSWSRFKRSYISGSQEFEYSKTQLQNLRNDIQNKVLEERLILQYLEQEKKAVEELEKYLQKIASWEQEAVKLSEKIFPDLQLVLDSCRQNH